MRTLTASCWVCGSTPASRCHKCGADICTEDTRYYHDDTNRAINASAKPECSMCFPPKFPRPFSFARAVERGEWEI